MDTNRLMRLHSVLQALREAEASATEVGMLTRIRTMVSDTLDEELRAEFDMLFPVDGQDSVLMLTVAVQGWLGGVISDALTGDITAMLHAKLAGGDLTEAAPVTMGALAAAVESHDEDQSSSAAAMLAPGYL